MQLRPSAMQQLRKSMAAMGPREWLLFAAVGVVAAVVGAVVTFFAAGSETVVVDNVAIHYSDLTSDPIPLTAEAAKALGWVDFGRCQVGRGRFFTNPSADESQPLLPIYHRDGQLVGINLVSAAEQPSPPWEFEETPITALEGRSEEHWAIGIYFVNVKSPASTCGQFTPGARLGYD